MPTFSIILPTYNRAKLLPIAVQSIINQSNNDWEVILIDDGSIDNTKAIIKEFKESRIHYIYQENRGRSSARNTGIKNANGDWICFLDSDDGYDVDHLETFRKAIQEYPNKTIFKTGVKFKDQNDKVIFQSKFKTEADHPLHFFSLKYCSILDLCISKTSLENVKFENISTWEDKAFLLDLLEHNTIHQISKRTVNALEHSERSVLKVYENPNEINSVLGVMSKKLNQQKASNSLISKVQQSFLLSILIDGNESDKSTSSLLSQLDIKPSWITRLKFLKARLLGN